MKKIALDVPAMYADHHVLAVRDALGDVPGIAELYASAAWKQVLVTYDSQKLEPDQIEKLLAEAGYPVGGEAPPILIQRDRFGRDPQWQRLGMRVTATNPADLALSGEHRRY
jgi:copper chaperone CopZ